MADRFRALQTSLLEAAPRWDMTRGAFETVDVSFADAVDEALACLGGDLQQAIHPHALDLGYEAEQALRHLVGWPVDLPAVHADACAGDLALPPGHELFGRLSPALCDLSVRCGPALDRLVTATRDEHLRSPVTLAYGRDQDAFLTGTADAVRDLLSFAHLRTVLRADAGTTAGLIEGHLATLRALVILAQNAPVAPASGAVNLIEENVLRLRYVLWRGDVTSQQLERVMSEALVLADTFPSPGRILAADVVLSVPALFQWSETDPVGPAPAAISVMRHRDASVAEGDPAWQIDWDTSACEELGPLSAEVFRALGVEPSSPGNASAPQAPVLQLLLALQAPLEGEPGAVLRELPSRLDEARTLLAREPWGACLGHLDLFTLTMLDEPTGLAGTLPWQLVLVGALARAETWLHVLHVAAATRQAQLAGVEVTEMADVELQVPTVDPVEPVTGEAFVLAVHDTPTYTGDIQPDPWSVDPWFVTGLFLGFPSAAPEHPLHERFPPLPPTVLLGPLPHDAGEAVPDRQNPEPPPAEEGSGNGTGAALE